jgi:hypothetical protein
MTFMSATRACVHVCNGIASRGCCCLCELTSDPMSWPWASLQLDHLVLYTMKHVRHVWCRLSMCLGDADTLLPLSTLVQ